MTAPLRVVVLCSGSASSLRFLCEHDPNYAKKYEVVGVFSDVPSATGLIYAKSRGIPTDALDFKKWCTQNDVALKDLKGRDAYFAEVLAIIKKWKPDFIILSGFMLRITKRLLAAFKGRILNVHPADLTILDEAGARKYTGLNVVARAMKAGDPTASTIHIVEDKPDMGPVITVSSPLLYKTGDDPGRHQEAMKTICDGPVYQAALEKLFNTGWPAIPWKG